VSQLFILLQLLAPQHLLSRLTGKLATSEIRWVKNTFIKLFAGHFNVNMQEAEETDLESYPSFNAFFTRALAHGARPVDSTANSLVCPADGTISQLGTISSGRIFQAKGRDFSCAELLGSGERAVVFGNGAFATIYLSPRDYHRVHMPIDGRLTAETYIPGSLFSVNRVTADNVERLFARNERLVCYFDTPVGPMAMILVGAMVVAGIATAWSGQVAPPPQSPRWIDYREPPAPVSLARGEEMGRFFLGSTVILLFPENSVTWEERFRAGSSTRMGEKLGTIAST
jgi:phosphatidylserine decarboxylase